jgi:hypothetical protein
MRVAPPRGLSAQGYPGYRGDSANPGLRVVGSLTVGQRGWDPYELVPHRHLEENEYPGRTRQMTDVRMGSASPLRLPSSDGGRSVATVGGSGAQRHPTSKPQHRDVTQLWEIYSPQQVEEHGMEMPRTHQQPLKGRRK